MIKLPDLNSPSEAVSPTIPFNEIKLYVADYYAGIASGSVAGSHSKWSKLANSPSTGKIPSVFKDQGKGLAGSIITSSMAQKDIIAKIEELKNNLIVYRGPIEFEIQKSFSPVVAKGNPGIKTETNEKEKEIRNRGMVNDPLGMYYISGLVFEPGQKVRARIELEGFVVQSEWVETEGLIVSEIENDSLKINTGLRSENYSAENSFVIVSAIRSEKAPEGNVKLLKGAAAPHGSVTGHALVNQFPEAVKAKIWFDQEISLRPLDNHPGCSVAETGEWSVDYNYSSPGDVINPAKYSKHPFELVSYIYKGKELGYAYFVNECAYCTSAVNVVKNLDTSNKRFNSALDRSISAPAEVPKVKPTVRPVIIK